MKLINTLILNILIAALSQNTLASELIEVTLKVRKPASATRPAPENLTQFAQMPPIEIQSKKFGVTTDIKRKN